jgi:hypothetical protein
VAVNPKTKALFEGMLEYAKFLPGKKKHPLEILVLRGHLLIEREIHALIAAKFVRPKVFDPGRYFFSDIARLAEALYGDSVPEWVWKETKDLNTIRNSLAHNLIDDTLRPRVERFVGRFKDRDPKTFKYVGETVDKQLAYCVAHLHHELLRIRHA